MSQPRSRGLHVPWWRHGLHCTHVRVGDNIRLCEHLKRLALNCYLAVRSMQYIGMQSWSRSGSPLAMQPIYHSQAVFSLRPRAQQVPCKDGHSARLHPGQCSAPENELLVACCDSTALSCNLVEKQVIDVCWGNTGMHLLS